MLTTQFLTLYTSDFEDRFANYVSMGSNLEEALENCIDDYEDECILEFPSEGPTRESFKQVLRMELTQHMISKETILSQLN
jgi:hypothetical protein